VLWTKRLEGYFEEKAMLETAVDHIEELLLVADHGDSPTEIKEPLLVSVGDSGKQYLELTVVFLEEPVEWVYPESLLIE
jgi:hypothetical protein